MENVIIKTAKAYGLFLLLVGLPYFLNVNVAIAFQEGFSSKNLTVEETFENGDAWTGDSYAYQQFAEDHSFKVVKDPVFDGDYIGKFELQYGDPMVTKMEGPDPKFYLERQKAAKCGIHLLYIFLPMAGKQIMMMKLFHSGMQVMVPLLYH